jgi:hypothetical protein
LYAAWDCDDNNNDVQAQECRNKALDLIGSVYASSQEIVTLELIRVDLLRRTGRFIEAIDIARELDFEGDLLAVARLQIRLCQAKDKKAHKFNEVASA